MDRPTCPRCGTAAKLRKRTPTKGALLFAWHCEDCGATGTDITPGAYWVSHLIVGALLGPHGDPVALAHDIPELT